MVWVLRSGDGVGVADLGMLWDCLAHHFCSLQGEGNNAVLLQGSVARSNRIYHLIWEWEHEGCLHRS